MKSSYNQKVVTAFFASQGIPAPDFEYQFHETRRWRFDLAFFWEPKPVAIEVQGGLLSGVATIAGRRLPKSTRSTTKPQHWGGESCTASPPNYAPSGLPRPSNGLWVYDLHGDAQT